jgi:hypothetical protein
MMIDYAAPATCGRFMRSPKFGRLIAGPVGSGKTTACIFELFRRACEQAPDASGIRKTRFAIVRQTLVQIRSTVLRDIMEWFGPVAEYKVTDQTVYLRFGDVYSEWLLIPLEKPEDQQRLLSSQLTGAWMSECIEMSVNLVAPLSGRCGRYPKPYASWKGVICDTNMPSEGSDWHNFMVNPSEEWSVYVQPGGMEENAENLEWLEQNEHSIKLPLGDRERRETGRGYYRRLLHNNNPDFVRRYVHAQFGNDPSGTAVYRTTFKRSFHVVDRLEPVAGKLLLIGQDFGRDPWSIITQVDHFGRLLVLEEVEAKDTGLAQHIAVGLRPALMQDRYLGKPIAIIGDPSGGNKSSLYEENEFGMLESEGFLAFKAPTNDPDRRISAVETWLMGARNGGAALLIDAERCPTIVRGFEGGYRFAFSRDGTRKPRPDKKGDYSHPHDALQYAALGSSIAMHSMIGGRVMRGSRRRERSPRASSIGWT